MTGHPQQSDPRVKIEWAKENILNLRDRIDGFIHSDAYELVPETDPQSGENVSRVQFKGPFDPELTCIAGDILHNLRSALDHSIFRIMLPTTDAQEIRRRAFPVGQSAQDYEGAVKPRRIKQLRADLVQRIDALEPYQGGKGHPIWQLHELNIIDKHRLLLTVGLAYHHMWRPAFNLSFPGWPGRLRSRTVPLQDGAPLPASTSNVNVGNKPFITIALNEPSIINPQPVIPLLVQFSDLVENILTLFDDV